MAKVLPLDNGDFTPSDDSQDVSLEQIEEDYVQIVSFNTEQSDPLGNRIIHFIVSSGVSKVPDKIVYNGCVYNILWNYDDDRYSTVITPGSQLHVMDSSTDLDNGLGESCDSETHSILTIHPDGSPPEVENKDEYYIEIVTVISYQQLLQKLGNKESQLLDGDDGGLEFSTAVGEFAFS